MMKYNINSYNQYKDTKASLYPKKTLWNKVKEFRWEIIIPLFVLILFILGIVCMQAPTGLA